MTLKNRESSSPRPITTDSDDVQGESLQRSLENHTIRTTASSVPSSPRHAVAEPNLGRKSNEKPLEQDPLARAIDLASIYERYGPYALAEEAYRQLTDDELTCDHMLSLNYKDKLSGVLCMRSQFHEAERTSREIIAERVENGVQDDQIALLAVGNLTLAMKYQGKSEAAASLLKDVLESTDKITVENRKLLSQLASLELDCGRYNVAGSLFYDAARESISASGAEHLSSSNDMSGLALTLSCRGQFAGAEMIYRLALDSLTYTIGYDPPDALIIARRLADCLRFQQCDEESIRLLEIRLDLQKKENFTINLESLLMKVSLGAMYVWQGYLNDARRMMEQVLSGMKELPELGSIWTSWIESILEAIRQLKQSLREKREDSCESRFSELAGLMGPGLGPILESNPWRYMDIDSPFTPVPHRVVILAAANGDCGKIKDYINRDTPSMRILSRALRAAAANHQLPAVRLLLDSGVSVNAEGAFYGTSLQAAAFSGDAEIVKFLMSNKANVNIKGGIFGSAMEAAVVTRKDDIVSLLIMLAGHNGLSQDILDSALLRAVRNGGLVCVDRLVDAGANIDAEDNLFGSALQQSCLGGRIKMTELLLKRGANSTIKKGLFGDPVQIACTTRDDDMLKLLFSLSAELDSLYAGLEFSSKQKRPGYGEASNERPLEKISDSNRPEDNANRDKVAGSTEAGLKSSAGNLVPGPTPPYTAEASAHSDYVWGPEWTPRDRR